MADTANIVMPMEQEGSKSVVRAWLKKVGDAVKRDEPIVELETDKVAVEVPSPSDGVLASIALNEGDEAAPGATLGVLTLGVIAATPAQKAPTQTQSSPTLAAPSRNDSEREMRLSPLVKRLLSDHRIDAAAVTGTGRDGRITHKDVQDHVARGPARAPAAPVKGGKIPHDAMRRSIAEHMARSVATAPHVTAVFEADLSAIIAHRAAHQEAFAARGAKLTLTAYFVAASARALQAVPQVNATFHADALELHPHCNIGVGTALGNEGLIVPVIQRAETLGLFGIAERLTALTAAARANRLAPEDVRGGTFTISNHGVSGSLVAAPVIINQPQVAILGVGKTEKRVVVHEIDGQDAILVRPMCYVSLTIDHRALDGFQTNTFLSKLVETLETWPASAQ